MHILVKYLCNEHILIFFNNDQKWSKVQSLTIKSNKITNNLKFLRQQGKIMRHHLPWSWLLSIPFTDTHLLTFDEGLTDASDNLLVDAISLPMLSTTSAHFTFQDMLDNSDSNRKRLYRKER